MLYVVRVALAAEQPPLRHVGSIPLGDVKGRIDHMALDADGSRLFVAALGNNTVEVIDLAAGKVAQHLTGMDEPQGVRFVAKDKTLVVASGGDGKCRFYNESLKLVATTDNLDDADNVRVDPALGRVYVGYGTGGLGIFENGHHFTGQFKLSGHPESFQVTANGKRIFVNVPAARLIQVIDAVAGKTIARWPVKEAEANFAMALDEANHRLIVVCRKPAKMLVFDTETGKIIASTAACGDADDVWLDAQAHRIYITGGEGCISVIDQPDADHYRATATIKTAPGARTSFFDSEKHRLYVAVPKREGQSAEIRIFAPP